MLRSWYLRWQFTITFANKSPIVPPGRNGDVWQKRRRDDRDGEFGAGANPGQVSILYPTISTKCLQALTLTINTNLGSNTNTNTNTAKFEILWLHVFSSKFLISSLSYQITFFRPVSFGTIEHLVLENFSPFLKFTWVWDFFEAGAGGQWMMRPCTNYTRTLMHKNISTYCNNTLKSTSAAYVVSLGDSTWG